MGRVGLFMWSILGYMVFEKIFNIFMIGMIGYNRNEILEFILNGRSLRLFVKF